MLDTRRLGWLVLAAAVGVTTALGVLGVGHGGVAGTNLDMRILYLAGVLWRAGSSAYTHVPHGSRRSVAGGGDQPIRLRLPAADRSPLPPAGGVVSGRRSCRHDGPQPGRGGAPRGRLRAIRPPSRSRPRRPQPADASGWLIPALVIGNFATAFVIWAGQTTLIATLALMLGWHHARRDRWLIGGMLLAVVHHQAAAELPGHALARARAALARAGGHGGERRRARRAPDRHQRSRRRDDGVVRGRHALRLRSVQHARLAHDLRPRQRARHRGHRRPRSCCRWRC